METIIGHHGVQRNGILPSEHSSTNFHKLDESEHNAEEGIKDTNITGSHLAVIEHVKFLKVGHLPEAGNKSWAQTGKKREWPKPRKFLLEDD